MSQNTDGMIEILVGRVTEATHNCMRPASERALIIDVETYGLELLRQFLLDINRCADALEILATDRKTARAGEKWP